LQSFEEVLLTCIGSRRSTFCSFLFFIFYFSGVSKRGRGRAITGESWDIDPIGKRSRNSDDRMRLSIQAMWGKGVILFQQETIPVRSWPDMGEKGRGMLRFPSE